MSNPTLTERRQRAIAAASPQPVPVVETKADQLDVYAAAVDVLHGAGTSATIGVNEPQGARLGALVRKLTGCSEQAAYHLRERNEAVRRVAVEMLDGQTFAECSRVHLMDRALAYASAIAFTGPQAESMTEPPNTNIRAAKGALQSKPTPAPAAPKAELHGRELLVHALSTRSATPAQPEPSDVGATLAARREPVADKGKHSKLTGRERLIAALQERKDDSK